MTNWLLRLTAALLLTYGVSRLLRRAPLRLAEPGRSLAVHACSAALVAALVYALRDDAFATILPIATQGGWLLLDLARARGVMATGR